MFSCATICLSILFADCSILLCLLHYVWNDESVSILSCYTFAVLLCCISCLMDQEESISTLGCSHLHSDSPFLLKAIDTSKIYELNISNESSMNIDFVLIFTPYDLIYAFWTKSKEFDEFSLEQYFVLNFILNSSWFAFIFFVFLIIFFLSFF